MADRRKLLREKKVQLPQFARDATVQPESFDADANTVDIIWTTGASVRRCDWWDGAEYDEVLSVDPKSVRLERLNLGAPFLDTHCSYALDNVIGSVVPGTAKIESGRGLATILLSRAPGVADTVQKIREGVIRNISVGYWIHKVEKTEADDGTVARWDVVDWEPLEISAVPIPADPGSQVRTATDTKDDKGPALRSCVLVTKKSPAAAPVSAKATKETRMAPRTAARTAAPKNAKEALKRLADLETENKRLAGLLAKREGDDKKDDEESDDERDGDDTESKKDDEGSDDERDGEDGDDKKDDEESDDERDGDDADEEDDCEDKDEERAGKGKRSLTDAEVRKAAEKAVRADRVRQAKIREIGGQFGFPKLADRHSARETSVREFKDLVLEKLSERQKKAGRTTFAAAGTPEIGDETRVGNNGPTAQSRAFDKGAAAAKALLGK